MYGTLDKNEIENILQSQIFGRLGCCNKDLPYVVPISYVYDGKNIFCQSQEGKKLQILRSNPNVCLEIDIINSFKNCKSVLVYGKFHELNHKESITARELLYSRVFTIMTESVVHRFEHKENSATLSDPNRIKDILFKIDISEITGRRENI